jgi:serine/threonine-protein kinase
MDIGTLDTPAGNCLWLREQRVVGESVREMLKQGPIPVGEVTTLARQMLEALADLERARIVHRDVKPDNIMRDMSGAYWLLDFGIARHLDLQSLTLTAALAGPGTLGYAPPEQYRNKKREVDGRADLFALGVTMVECLTGKHPFREGARDVGEVIRRIEGTAVAVPQIRGDAGGKIADFIRAMVQRRLDCRPATAQDAGDWLNEACGLPKA